jgi:hypothetical protein
MTVYTKLTKIINKIKKKYERNKGYREREKLV